MTLYLKYRPQKIDELDLDSVRETLQKILKSDRSPHAFLFCGPRGSGKTSSARILAKAINCEKPKSGEPCNKCSQCEAITRGSSLDVIEIDAASHRGVDDVRSLREAVKLAPGSAKKKVYIIDEAHMLTTEASNALLKTLEEPPDHVVFVLATTTPEKLLDTIRSRCTTLNFQKATGEEISRSLERVVKGEKIKVNKGVLAEIAKVVDGSFREAHKVLEQLSFTGKTIKVSDVRKLSSIGGEDPKVLLNHLATRDTTAALAEIDSLVKNGVDLRTYTSELIGVLRRELLRRIEVDEEPGDIGKMIDLFSDSARKLPAAIIAQLPLELAVVKWCESKSQKSKVKSQNVEVKESHDEVVVMPGVEMPDPTAHESTPAPRKEKKKWKGDLGEAWGQIMKGTKAKNHSVEALLRAARPQDFDGATLKLEVLYKFHKERLESEPYRGIVEGVAGEVFGIPVRVVCFLSDSRQKAVDLANVTEEVEEDIVKAAEEIFSSGEQNPN